MEGIMKQIRWGVIGAGGIADRRTIPGLLKAKNAELIAVMEINRDFAESIRVKYNAKYAYDSENSLLENPEIDAVYIASPVVFHAQQAKMAADAGKHIFVEKPVAMSSKEGKDVLEYCNTKGVLIGAGLMMRFGTHVMNMKRAVSEGKVGTVVSGYSQFTLWLPSEEGNWRQDKSKAGGGCMMDMGIHCIDLMEYITGQRVSHVAALNETVIFDYDVEDSSTVMMRLEKGAQCVVSTNFNIPDKAARWRLELFGTKGRLMGDTIIGQNDGGKLNAVFLDDVVGYNAAQDHADDEGVFLEGDFGNLYTREITSFSDSILNNKPLEVPASDAVHVQSIMEAAYQSYDEFKIIKV
jgi:predicted dehydrogenase